MRVKYKSRTFSLRSEVENGSAAEWMSVINSVFAFLIEECGAPLNLETYGTSADYSEPSTTTYGSVGGGARFNGEQTDPENYKASQMSIQTTGFSDTSGNSYIGLSITACGRDGGEQTYSYNMIPISVAGSKSFSFTIHAVKSGNSFYFGIGNPSGANGRINMAITPMRSLSNPDVDYGYGLVCGPYYSIYANMVYYSRSVPYIEGMTYIRNPYYSITAPITPDIFMYPEVETGKIPMAQMYSGCEDIYYENVYITTIRSDGLEEKAVETDKGVFLISNTLDITTGVDWSEMSYCQLAFDITESVTNAE